jgi:hypothetical protein
MESPPARAFLGSSFQATDFVFLETGISWNLSSSFGKPDRNPLTALPKYLRMPKFRFFCLSLPVLTKTRVGFGRD